MGTADRSYMSTDFDAVFRLFPSAYIHLERKTRNLRFTYADRKRAEGIFERNQTFTRLGAKPELAEENACRMEHVVTDEMMEVFRNYIKD